MIPDDEDVTYKGIELASFGRPNSFAALERMKAQIRNRPTGATVLAIVLGWLGVGGLLNAVGWPLLRSSPLLKSAPPAFVAKFPPLLGSFGLSLFALAYGVSALVAARGVWHQQ